jgi:glutamate formiminotransferase/formiminotetrahydrofolate cyclodeaminase
MTLVGAHVSLSTLSMDAFIRKLASADPTPGGGSVAAAVGAFGAALVRMVALLTANSPKHTAVAQRCTEVAAAAQTLADELLALVDADAASFDRVSAAYKLPKADDAQKASRSQSIQDALAGAIEPPLRVIDAAATTCSLALTLADIGNPNALSDVGCATLCARSAAQGAALNVEINAAALKDRSRADEVVASMHAQLAQVNLLAEVILGKLDAGAGD